MCYRKVRPKVLSVAGGEKIGLCKQLFSWPSYALGQLICHGSTLKASGDHFSLGGDWHCRHCKQCVSLPALRLRFGSCGALVGGTLGQQMVLEKCA